MFFICVSGAGIALVFIPSVVLLGNYFQKRYVLANGIAFCGYSLGLMVIPRLAQLTIEVSKANRILVKSTAS